MALLSINLSGTSVCVETERSKSEYYLLYRLTAKFEVPRGVLQTLLYSNLDAWLGRGYVLRDESLASVVCLDLSASRHQRWRQEGEAD